MSSGSKPNNSLDVTLHNGVATLPGTGGASIASWAMTSSYMPRFAVLVFTNNGVADLTIGQSSPAFLLVNSVPVGVLFEGLSVVVAAGASVYAMAPADAAGLGNTWSISSDLDSGSSVNVTVVARPFLTTEELPSAADNADAVWDEILSGHLTASSAGLALFIAKGLGQCNFVMDNTTFDAAGMLTAARIRIFANAAAATSATQGGSGEGEILALVIAGSGATPGQLQLYKSIQQ